MIPMSVAVTHNAIIVYVYPTTPSNLLCHTMPWHNIPHPADPYPSTYLPTYLPSPSAKSIHARSSKPLTPRRISNPGMKRHQPWSPIWVPGNPHEREALCPHSLTHSQINQIPCQVPLPYTEERTCIPPFPPTQLKLKLRPRPKRRKTY